MREVVTKTYLIKLSVDLCKVAEFRSEFSELMKKHGYPFEWVGVGEIKVYHSVIEEKVND